MKPVCVILTGPTASGKTDVALEIADATRAEIVSADSRQVYIGMDIGTAKPTAQEQSVVPHHMIDVVRPDEHYSAGMYSRHAVDAVDGIAGRGRLPLVVGGCGLYLKALADGLFECVEVSPELREELRGELAVLGVQQLHAELTSVDPMAASRINQRDVPRILRALEVFRATGRPISSFQTGRHDGLMGRFDMIWVGLSWPRATLYERIGRRVDRMFEAGLVQEVEGLLNGYSESLDAFRTVGYREVIDYLRGDLTIDCAVSLTKRNTRRYAKRQLTWFGQEGRIRWVDAERGNPADTVGQMILQELASS